MDTHSKSLKSFVDSQHINIRVDLQEKDLWSKFHGKINEMIVTKNGRRMFPVIKVNISGLEPNTFYSILLEFKQIEKNRWKYINGDWLAGGKAEPPPQNPVYEHPDSPNYGSHWAKEPISFAKVKLTNKSSTKDKIMLNSLHKYEPRLLIYKVGPHQGNSELVYTLPFPVTQFIAVTAYQNEDVTTLKIDHNPFAKAFKDTRDRPMPPHSLTSASANAHVLAHQQLQFHVKSDQTSQIQHQVEQQQQQQLYSSYPTHNYFYHPSSVQRVVKEESYTPNYELQAGYDYGYHQFYTHAAAAALPHHHQQQMQHYQQQNQFHENFRENDFTKKQQQQQPQHSPSSGSSVSPPSESPPSSGGHLSSVRGSSSVGGYSNSEFAGLDFGAAAFAAAYSNNYSQIFQASSVATNANDMYNTTSNITTLDHINDPPITPPERPFRVENTDLDKSSRSIILTASGTEYVPTPPSESMLSDVKDEPLVNHVYEDSNNEDWLPISPTSN